MWFYSCLKSNTASECWYVSGKCLASIGVRHVSDTDMTLTLKCSYFIVLRYVTKIAWEDSRTSIPLTLISPYGIENIQKLTIKVPRHCTKTLKLWWGLRVIYLYSNTPPQVKHIFYGPKPGLLCSGIFVLGFLDMYPQIYHI